MNFKNLASLSIESKIESIQSMPIWACNLQTNCKAINNALADMGCNRRLGYAHGCQSRSMTANSTSSEYFWFTHGDDLYDHRNTRFFNPKNWQDALISILSF